MNLAELKRDPVKFLETFFLLKDTGKPIKLERWQVKFLRDLFSEQKPVSLAVLSTCKKQGKSTLAAGCALYILLCWPNSEVYFVANSHEQAQTLAFSSLSWACENQPDLAKACTVQRDKVIVNSTGAIAKCLPTKAKTVAGLLPSLTIFDEAWGLASEDEEIWSELTSIPTKRSITLVCSYAGLEGQSPLLRRLYELGKSKQKPRDMLFFWSHNPKLSSWVSDEYLTSQRQKLLPHQFSRLFENKWTSGAGAFIPADDWKKCVADIQPVGPDGQEILYLGLDIGIRRDSTCLAGVVRDGDTYRLAHFKAWLPRTGHEVELEAVYEYLVQMAKQYHVAGLWYDPRECTSIVQRLQQMGVKCVEVSPMPSSISRVNELFYQLIKSCKFQHWDEKTLTNHILNAVASETPQGTVLDKSNRQAKIDGAVALSLAVWGASQQGQRMIKIHSITTEPATLPTSSSWQQGHRRKRPSGESPTGWAIRQVSR